MRKILYLCILWLITSSVVAQNQITEYEYWIDDDIGNRTKISLTTPSDKINMSELIDINSLEEGLHSIAIRFRDGNKKWSTAMTKQFIKRSSNTSSTNLIAIEYWFDNDIANAVKTSFAPTAKLDHSELVDLSALSDGVHLLSYRVQNERKNWSTVISKQFIKRKATTTAQKLTTIQYWFDSDIANAVTNTFATTNKLDYSEMIDLSRLSDGVHLINYRLKSEAGSWSTIVSKQFIKREDITTAQKLNTIQYWFDNDIANAVTNTFAASDKLDHSELIDLSALSDGIHLLSYRIKNESNTWSTIVSKQFIKREGNTQAHQLVKVQYWFDNDIDKAVSINIPATNQLNMNELIDLANLSEGLHVINARVMDESNIWSTVVSKQFVKREIKTAAKLQQYRYWFNDDIANTKTTGIDPSVKQISLDKMVDVTTIPPGDNQSINYQFKDDQGNWSMPVSHTFNRVAVVKANFTADKTSNCGPMTVQFTNNSTDGESYEWDFGDGKTSTEKDPTHTYETVGSFTVKLTTTNNTYTKSDVLTQADFITIHAIPSIDLGDDVTVCKGSEHTFTAPDGFSKYIWNEVEGTKQYTSATVGDINIKVIDANGCEATDVVNLSNHPEPSVNLGDDVMACVGTGHTFTAPDGFTKYIWNNVEGTKQYTTATTGDINLKVIDVNGCEATDVVKLSNHAAPSVNLGDDVMACVGAEHTFTAPDGFSKYIWNNVEGTKQYTTATVGDINLKVVDANGCEATDVVKLSNHPEASVDLGVDVKVCTGSEHTFTVNDEFEQYYWNNIKGDNTFVANAEGDYTLRVVNAQGCEATDVVNLSYHTPPSVTLNDAEICKGNEHTFNVSSEFSKYFWNNQEGSHQFKTSNQGNYTLKVVDANGCEATDQASLTVHELPAISLGDDQTACKGEEINLSVTNTYNKYYWNQTEGSNKLMVTASGTYQLRVVDSNGCEATDAVSITFNPNPQIDLGDDVDLCQGDTHSLQVASGFQKYIWNNTEGSNSLDVNTGGTYTLKVINQHGCSATDDVEVTVHDLPAKPIARYEDGLLSTDLADKYQWYLNNEIMNDFTGQEFTPNQDGDYAVEIWSEFGCKSELSETVKVVIVGIEDLIREKISIYPNPTKDKVVIDLSQNFDYNADIQFKILDASGKVIMQNKLSPITTIDLSGHSPGLYFIHFLNLNEIVTFKIIKQ